MSCNPASGRCHGRIERVDAALRDIFCDAETVRAAVAHIFGDTIEHHHGHQRIAARRFHVLNELGGIGVSNFRVSEVGVVPVVRGIVGPAFQLLREVALPPQRTTVMPLSVMVAASFG